MLFKQPMNGVSCSGRDGFERLLILHLNNGYYCLVKEQNVVGFKLITKIIPRIAGHHREFL